MTKATMGDMHMMLMEQMQRMMECEPGSDDMAEEVERSRAVAQLGNVIIANANTMIRAATQVERGNATVPALLIGRAE